MLLQSKLTRKKVKKRVCKDEKFIDTLSEERKKFINKINTIDKDKIISIDETGINNVLKSSSSAIEEANKNADNISNECIENSKENDSIKINCLFFLGF